MKKLVFGFALLLTAAIGSLAFIPQGPTPITLFWNRSPAPVDAYYLYYSTSSVAPLPWQPLTNAPGTATNVVVNLAPGNGAAQIHPNTIGRRHIT